MIPISQPYLPAGALKYAKAALDSTWISSHGKYINLATEKLQEILNIKHVLLVNNGTSAVHLLSRAVSHKHPEINKLIIPNNIYIAAINGFLFDKKFLLKPCDASVSTWNYDIDLLEKIIDWENNGHAGVLIVHNLGNIINVPRLIRKYPNIIFVEDNCEGLFGTYEGQQSGTASFASAISFFGNKNITCGEGGAFITNDTDTYEYVKCLHGQGQSPKKFVHDEMGYNYRMTNIQAAILLGQIEMIDEIKEKKLELFEAYRRAVESTGTSIYYQSIEDNTSPANWMFGVRVVGNTYEETESYFNSCGIEIRPMFYPLSSHKYLKNEIRILSSTEDIAIKLNHECFILPSYPDLTKNEIKHITDTLFNYYLLG
jgi:perosamine synthetase